MTYLKTYLAVHLWQDATESGKPEQDSSETYLTKGPQHAQFTRSERGTIATNKTVPPCLKA